MRVVKEVLDRLLSFLGLVLLSPLFAGLALWIVLESGRPVIFRQTPRGQGREAVLDAQVPHDGRRTRSSSAAS